MLLEYTMNIWLSKAFLYICNIKRLRILLLRRTAQTYIESADQENADDKMDKHICIKNVFKENLSRKFAQKFKILIFRDKYYAEITEENEY